MAFFSPLESQTISVGDRDLMNACILEEVSFSISTMSSFFMWHSMQLMQMNTISNIKTGEEYDWIKHDTSNRHWIWKRDGREKEFEKEC